MKEIACCLFNKTQEPIDNKFQYLLYLKSDLPIWRLYLEDIDYSIDQISVSLKLNLYKSNGTNN